jgi:hypothetical protein
MDKSRAEKLRNHIKNHLKYWEIYTEGNRVLAKYSPKGREDNSFYDKFIDLIGDNWILNKWYMGKKEIKSIEVEDFLYEVGQEIMKNPEILTKIEE